LTEGISSTAGQNKNMLKGITFHMLTNSESILRLSNVMKFNEGLAFDTFVKEIFESAQYKVFKDRLNAFIKDYQSKNPDSRNIPLNDPLMIELFNNDFLEIVKFDVQITDEIANNLNNADRKLLSNIVNFKR